MRRLQKRFQSPKSFEKLEPRHLLAATLYVDFGFGFNAGSSIDVTDVESASLNGPQVFGTGYELESYTSILINQDLPDQNGDNVVDQVDVQAKVADLIIEELTELFEPFDVTIVQTSASSFDDIGSSLESSATNDTYILVGGRKPDGVYRPADGAAKRDAGNTEDNLAFVFPIDADAGRLGENYYHRMVRAIGQQAGTTWGLSLIEASNQIAADDVMALPGTEANGDLLEDNRSTYQNLHFTRTSMEVMQFRGESPGVQNSFLALKNAVGLAGSVEYFTTTGLEDAISATIVGTNLIDVQVNEDFYPAVDTSNGLKFVGTGRTKDVLTIDGQSIHLVVDDYSGTANSNIEFQGISSLETGDFEDQITINGLFNSISTGDSNDEIIFQADLDLSYNFGKVMGEGGDDELIFLTEQQLAIFDGGEGFDRVDLSALESTTQHLFASDESGISIGFFSFGVGEKNLNQVEHVTGPDNGMSIFQYGFNDCIIHFCDSSAPILRDYIIAEVEDNKVTFFDQEHEVPMVFENFDNAIGDEVRILSMNRDMEVTADKVQLSSDRDYTQGTTEGFTGNLKVTDASQFVISNMAGGATDSIQMYEERAYPENFIIEGMTEGRLDIDAARIIAHGSDKASDRFQIGSAYRELFIQGHGGDDSFLFSWTDGSGNGNLEHLTMTPHVFAGAGSDWLYASDFYEDDGSELVRNHAYLLNDNWVTNSQDPRGSGERYFKGIYHEDVERVRVQGSPEANIFRVSPSTQISYNIEGGAGDSKDTLMLVGDDPTLRNYVRRDGTGTGTGTWWFSGDGSEDRSKVILFSEMQRVAGVERMAVAASAGSNSGPIVQVYDPIHKEKLFDINTYTSGFKGGIQVATGDLNGDAVPDIVVAPGAGRYSLVMAFDGLTGQLLTKFFAFPAPYNKGVDIAVGNVHEPGNGDNKRNEIIVSTLNDGMQVKVFGATAQDPMDFQPVLEYSPYAGNAPKVGIRIETADMNWDGVEDIIAVPGPGWLPQVAIHSVVDETPSQVNRFLAYVQNYRGGLHVAVGDMVGNRKPELIIGAGLTQRADNPFSGQFRVFQGEKMPRDAGLHMPAPVYSIDAFSGTQQVSVGSLDSDLDGRIDEIFAGSIGGENTNRNVSFFSTNGTPTSGDVIQSGEVRFRHGISVG